MKTETAILTASGILLLGFIAYLIFDSRMGTIEARIDTRPPSITINQTTTATSTVTIEAPKESPPRWTTPAPEILP